MTHVVRRALVGLTTAAVLGTVSVTPADAAPVSTEAKSAAGWLKGELSGNGLVQGQYTDFSSGETITYTDYGLSLDFFFAFDALDQKRHVRRFILDAVEPHADEYTSFQGDLYAGAVAKLLTAVLTDGRGAASYSDGDLLGTLESLVVTEGEEKGRASDTGDTDYSSTITQSYAVRALALAQDKPFLRKTTKFLLAQQSKKGWFREGLGADGFKDSDPSVDSTAFALTALRQAKAAGIKHLKDDVRDAVRWLVKRQNDDGSFTGNGVPNANTTGLAGTVLAGPEPKAAKRAAKWLRKHQVKDSAGAELSDEVGAVAYDDAALTDATANGITDATRDQFRRATAQAAPALAVLKR